MINLGVYTAIVVVILILYLVGIGVHGYVKTRFNEIIQEIKAQKNNKNISVISYPIYLAYRRALLIHWLLNGLFTIMALISAFIWFGLTVPLVTDSNIPFSSEINIIEIFGILGIITPSLLGLAIVFLILSSIEILYYRSWLKKA